MRLKPIRRAKKSKLKWNSKEGGGEVIEQNFSESDEFTGSVEGTWGKREICFVYSKYLNQFY